MTASSSAPAPGSTPPSRSSSTPACSIPSPTYRSEITMQKFAAVAALAIVASIGMAARARARAYPSKPIHVYVTSTAGGPLDVFTRLVTSKMEERLKQPFVVENKGGAGGNLAVTATLQA